MFIIVYMFLLLLTFLSKFGLFSLYLLRTLALIKPGVVTKIGDVLEQIYSSNLIVTKAKMTKLTW